MVDIIEVQGPQELPVTLEQVKAFMRVDTSDYDDLISGLINAATAYFDGPDGITGLALMPQTWILWLSEWPADERIELPLGPVLALNSITYLDSTATLQTLSPLAYSLLDNQTVVITPDGTWPSVYSGREDAIRLEFQAGHQSLTSPEQIAVPDGIRHAIIATVQYWYDNQANSGLGVPEIAYTLVAPYRKRRFGYG